MSADITHIEVTTHAKRRFRERVGLPTRAVYKAAVEALTQGLAVNDLPAPLRDRLTSMARRHDPVGRAFIRVHKSEAYVFCPRRDTPTVAVLLTVLPNYQIFPDREPQR